MKAEFRKLLTVRSTYVISLVFLLLAGFLAFYVQGFKNSADLNLTNGTARFFVAGTITQIADTLAVAGALIALLLLAHEYRYNTIVYTLTTSNSRSKVMASKIVAILVYVFIFALAAAAIVLGLIWAGVAASGHSIPHQDISYLTYLAKTIFLCEADAMAGLLFISLIRNQVGAIAALFIIPNTVEGLLSLLLKHNSIYMPFTALQQVIQPPVVNGIAASHRTRDMTTGYLSAPRGALVFLAYLIVGWIITWYLFLRRDATT
ncbi:MAG: ABC transporter permease subunit [Candidatus Saccharimonadales bacterium]|jgi:ABC-type transport system involved in multi-copper enzyme maturation permease subunit